MSFNREFSASEIQSAQWQSLTGHPWDTFNETWDDIAPSAFNRETIILPESWEAQTTLNWEATTNNWDSDTYKGFLRE